MATPTKDQLIRFRCKCGKKLKAERDIIGRKVQCTQCPRIHRVPESDRLGPKPKQTPKPETEQTSSTKTGSAKTVSAKAPTAATRKKKKRDAATAIPTQPAAQSKTQSTVVREQPSLFINDEMAAKEPSLLPGSDDSDSRFKLDPKFDPEPSEQLPAPDNSFEFNLDDLEVDTDALPKQDNRSQRTATKSADAFDSSEHSDRKPSSIGTLRPRIQRSISKPAALTGVAVVLSLLFLATIGWFVLGDPSFPSEFSERPEVQNYVTKLKEFRKSQRELEIVSEAYVKSKSPPAQEREQIEAFNRSIEPLANKEEKLTEALELFQASQVDKARSALITATEALDQKIPELQAKAKDFASKLR